MGKEVGCGNEREYLWKWFTRCYYSLPFVVLWGVSLHISHKRRLDLRQMKQFSQEHVVNKLSPGFFSLFYSCLPLTLLPAQLDSDPCIKFCIFYYCAEIWYSSILCSETMGEVCSSRSSFFLQGTIFICIYKPCAAKALNLSIAWHTHTHTHTHMHACTNCYTLNSRGLECLSTFANIWMWLSLTTVTLVCLLK